MAANESLPTTTLGFGDDRDPNLLRVNLVGFGTIVRREVRRVMRIWVQTIVPPAITMTLYFIIFGSLIGRRIGEMDGVPYMTFIAPGLIMMAVITNSFGNVVSSFFSGKLHRHLEEMLVSPLVFPTIVTGYVIGGVVRGLAVAALVTTVALMFTDLNVVHPFITVSVVILTSMVFSLAGLLNAIFAKNFDICVDTVDLPRWRVLFHLSALADLAGHRAAQSDPLHGQRVSLWNARFLGYSDRHGLRDYRHCPLRPVRDRAFPAPSRNGHPDVTCVAVSPCSRHWRTSSASSA